MTVFGSSSDGNEIVHNSIFDNGALGIDLGNDSGPDGRNTNDNDDADSGPNTLLNSPVLTARTLNPGQVTFAISVNVPSASLQDLALVW